MATLEATAPAQETSPVEELVRSIERQSVKEVAARRGTIDQIGEQSADKIEKLFGGTPETEGLREEALRVSASQQEERMQAVGGDTDVHVEETEPDVAGYYDGRLVIAASVVAAGGDEVPRTYKHEHQHKEDKTDTLGDIDAPVIPRTGIAEIDKEMADTTGRDVLELRAMRAEKAPPQGVYIKQHWEPALKLRAAFEQAGVDGEEALDAYARNDQAALQRARTKVLMYHLMAA